MLLQNILASALFAAGAIANPLPEPETGSVSSWLGGPLINCLSDSQAGQIVNAFESILTNPNRQQANKTAQALIANNYQEISDSINSLAGFPLGSVTFNGKTAFINGVVGAPAIQGMSTLSIYHDCTHITWRWLVTGLGSKAQEVKGINVMTINNQGQLIESDIEFNSIAWGADTGYTTLFPGQACPAQ